MSVSNGPSIVTSGLVLSLDAGDRNSYVGSGTTWTDLSGNSNNGTLTNGPTFSSANGGNIVFDGTDDYTDCGNGSTLNFTTNSFSISTWVKTNAIGTTRFITGKMNGAGIASSIGYGLYLGNAGTLWSFAVWPGTSNLVVNTGLFVQTNTWVNLVGVRNVESSLAILYTNGVQANAIATTATNVSTAVPFIVGGITTSSTVGNRWDGSIASTQVYNRALSASEVLQNYNATKTRFGL